MQNAFMKAHLQINKITYYLYGGLIISYHTSKWNWIMKSVHGPHKKTKHKNQNAMHYLMLWINKKHHKNGLKKPMQYIKIHTPILKTNILYQHKIHRQLRSVKTAMKTLSTTPSSLKMWASDIKTILTMCWIMCR